jgi:hypothetical protein
MKENRRTTYRISEAARELGISIEWLRKGEARDLDDRDLYILAGIRPQVRQGPLFYKMKRQKDM